MEINKVGIVGCGLMGSGIAEVCARTGYQVVVREVNDGFLQGGLSRIQTSLARAVKRGKATQEQADQTMSRIQGTLTLADFAGCDLVIEAAVENMSIKKQVFSELDGILPSHAVLASNTSSLCITEMASATNRGDRVLGIHFSIRCPLCPSLSSSAPS